MLEESLDKRLFSYPIIEYLFVRKIKLFSQLRAVLRYYLFR